MLQTESAAERRAAELGKQGAGQQNAQCGNRVGGYAVPDGSEPRGHTASLALPLCPCGHTPAHRDHKLHQPREQEWLLIEWPRGEADRANTGCPIWPRTSLCAGFPPSQSDLGPGLSKMSWRTPGSRACCFSTCAGSLTTQDRRSARVSRSPPCCLPLNGGQGRRSEGNFRSSITPPTDAVAYASVIILRRYLQDSGSGWSRLLLSCRALSSPATCRFISALPIGFLLLSDLKSNRLYLVSSAMTISGWAGCVRKAAFQNVEALFRAQQR